MLVRQGTHFRNVTFAFFLNSVKKFQLDTICECYKIELMNIVFLASSDWNYDIKHTAKYCRLFSNHNLACRFRRTHPIKFNLRIAHSLRFRQSSWLEQAASETFGAIACKSVRCCLNANFIITFERETIRCTCKIGKAKSSTTTEPL